MKSAVALIFLTLLVSSRPVSATQLSKNLSASDIKTSAAILGFGSMHRPFTAHSMPSGELGMDLGLESAFAFRRGMLDQGDSTAVVPRVIPIPRAWMSWEFPYDLIFSASFAPGFLFDGVTQYGGALQWFFYEYSELATVISFVGGYSHVDAFSDLKADVFSFDVQASRDLRLWQPYAGVGILLNRASVHDSLAASGVDSGSYYLPRPHIVFGARVDLLTKISVQLDVSGSLASLGLLLENSF